MAKLQWLLHSLLVMTMLCERLLSCIHPRWTQQLLPPGLPAMPGVGAAAQEAAASPCLPTRWRRLSFPMPHMLVMSGGCIGYFRTESHPGPKMGVGARPCIGRPPRVMYM